MKSVPSPQAPSVLTASDAEVVEVVEIEDGVEEVLVLGSDVRCYGYGGDTDFERTYKSWQLERLRSEARTGRMKLRYNISTQSM
jgi:tRNA A37 methylthiotransferase MiaB